MSAYVQAVALKTLAPPELNRRPRRRRAFVLLLFALLCFAVTGLFTMLLFSDEVANAREGLLAMGIMLCGGTALLFAIALLVQGLRTLRPDVVRHAAWLEDPFDRTSVRWWKGWAWTAHTHPRDPAVVALAPLTGSSRRRHRQGLVLLIGGGVVAVGAVLLSEVLVDPSNSAARLVGPIDVWSLARQVAPFAGLVALIGLYLLLTLDDDPRAGWKPDPLDDARLRWWDGRSWTDFSADPGAV